MMVMFEGEAAGYEPEEFGLYRPYEVKTSFAPGAPYIAAGTVDVSAAPSGNIFGPWLTDETVPSVPNWLLVAGTGIGLSLIYFILRGR